MHLEHEMLFLESHYATNYDYIFKARCSGIYHKEQINIITSVLGTMNKKLLHYKSKTIQT